MPPKVDSAGKNKEKGKNKKKTVPKKKCSVYVSLLKFILLEFYEFL